MPITQSRVLSILDDFDNMREAFLALREEVITGIEAYLSQADAGKDECLVALKAIALSVPEPTSRNAAIERYHFRKFAARNTRQKARMTQKRRLAGIVSQLSPEFIRDGLPTDPVQRAIEQAVRSGAVSREDITIIPDEDAVKPEDTQDLSPDDFTVEPEPAANVNDEKQRS